VTGTGRAVTQTRTVDPYGDPDVIDSRAPRFNQATVAGLTILALATGWWWLTALLAVQLAVGLAFGRRYCLPCVFYFEVVQPRIGEGEIEDSRPPRFANILGAVFLGASTAAHVLGLHVVGWVLAGLVAGLATLAAATGLCVGCELYRLLARVRGIHPGATRRVDLDDLETSPVDGVVVQFTHPLCTACRTVAQKLTAEGHEVVLVDISQRPDLARKYGIGVVPTALALAADGEVLARLA
jgi:hypothetical protein